MFGHRRSNQQQTPHRGPAAVPVTADQVDLMHRCLLDHDQLVRAHRADLGGSGRAVSEAARLLGVAGVAGALGHQTVPVPVDLLGVYHAALTVLQTYQPHHEQTSRLARLLPRLHLLAGIARIRCWHADYQPGTGLVWAGAPPASADLDALLGPDLTRPAAAIH